MSVREDQIWRADGSPGLYGVVDEPRQYLPRTLGMTVLTQDHLDDIAAQLNTRPRPTLQFQTPLEAIAAMLR